MDPRFGALSPTMEQATLTTPMTASITRAAELADENDIFSHTKLTNTTTINDKTTTAEYIIEGRTWTTTTPEGRQAIIIRNEKGRPITYWPIETMFLTTIWPKTKTIPVPVKNFDDRSAANAKYIQPAAKNIPIQMFCHHELPAVAGLAHVRRSQYLVSFDS